MPKSTGKVTNNKAYASRKWLDNPKAEFHNYEPILDEDGNPGMWEHKGIEEENLLKRRIGEKGLRESNAVHAYAEALFDRWDRRKKGKSNGN